MPDSKVEAASKNDHHITITTTIISRVEVTNSDREDIAHVTTTKKVGISPGREDIAHVTTTKKVDTSQGRGIISPTTTKKAGISHGREDIVLVTITKKVDINHGREVTNRGKADISSDQEDTAHVTTKAEDTSSGREDISLDRKAINHVVDMVSNKAGISHAVGMANVRAMIPMTNTA